MGKQVIISIGREYGSAGHLIAEKVAAKLNMELYDRNLLDEVANVKNVDTNNLSKYDEKPHRFFGSRTVRGYSNSPEENVAQLQLALLKSKAAAPISRCQDRMSDPDLPILKYFHCLPSKEWHLLIRDCRHKQRQLPVVAVHVTLERWNKKPSLKREMCVS